MPPSKVTPHSSLTASVEDYLKAVYRITLRSDVASTSELAAELNVAAASVTGMVRRLAEQGLLDHVPYRGVRLTASGRQAALRTIRRHRIIETYLTRVLHYPWDHVHDEAEHLEHAASDELIERMAEALGHPEEDPHGAPIPAADGTVLERTLLTLADMDTGVRVRIVMVSDRDAALLRYLAEQGLKPGAEVKIIDKAPFDGPITLGLRSRKKSPVIGTRLAEQILVEEIPAVSRQRSR